MGLGRTNTCPLRTPGTYNKVCHFCDCLANVFSGMSTVESDVSVICYEARSQHRMLSNLSLAGILHSKQWNEVRGTSFRKRPVLAFHFVNYQCG